MFLTRDEIAELTGYKRPSAQIRWFKAHGWPFEISSLGEPKILRAVVLARLGGSSQNDEPTLRLRNATA
jgi:hypothetical protein